VKKHIYIYSPSGAVRDKAAFKRGVKRLQTLGHEVEVDGTALASHQRFAGDDSTRLAALHRAAASGADMALMSRGGYGLSRLLADINYKTITKAIDNGTQFAGFSDFTALQMALLATTGAVTWAGPAVCADFGAQQPDDIMEACFDDWVTGQGEGTGWQLPKPPRPAIAADIATQKTTISIAQTSIKTRDVDIFDVKNALLWGGNLAMLASLVGTPYLPALPVIHGGVLFLEDTGEHPYRIERMLTQLLHAGVLAQQQAIIFGQFTHYQAVPHDKGFKLASAVQWLQSRVKARVLTGLPFGHVATKVMLPVGQRVALAVEGRDAFVLWGHQHDPDHSHDHIHRHDHPH
jgi:muramoyltetrapeptide carboxypeptidase